MSARRRHNADLSRMMGFTNAGNLDKRIELMKLDYDNNTVGGRRNENWVSYAKAWASVQFGTGNARFRNHQQQAEITHAIAIRYRTDVEIDRTHRVRMGKREFEIEFISNFEENNRFLILYCVERV